MKPVKAGERAAMEMDLSRYWLEKKLDGHRAILTVEKGKKSLWTRQRNPIKVPENLRIQLNMLKAEDGTVLDGEIWNPLKRGGWVSDGGEPCVISFWDCVQRGQKNLASRPLEERRAELLSVIGHGLPEVRIVEQEQATKEGLSKILREAEAFRRESKSRSGFVHGAVLKLKGSPRRDHPTRSVEHADWLKVVLF